MISVSGKKWTEKIINKNSVDKIKQDHGFSEVLAKLVVSKKFNKTEIFNIDNDLELTNKFLNNKDYILASEILTSSIKNKEKICILGDYDVDGCSSTSLLVRFLRFIKQPYFYYIPDREKDGYGASKKLFQKLIQKKPKLIIMVDCGSGSHDAIDFLNKNNIKSLIIDHHEIDKPFPEANMIINPKKNSGYIEYDYFCATTLVYFFLDLLIKKIEAKINIFDYLIYVLLATVCDVMPIRKLNRLIAIIALKNFDINKNIAFKELFKLTNKKNKLNINDLGYLIGPIINAGGRLGKSSFASELLSSDNFDLINKRSSELIKLNDKRKKIETLILDAIDFQKLGNNKDVIIYYKPNINEGLIGIIAARLKDYFDKPSIVITNSNTFLKGSARSVLNYNIGRAIKNSLDLNIIINGGGHNAAAGFTLQKSNLKKFESFILKDFASKKTLKDKKFKYDAELSSLSFNEDFFNNIKKIEPFGVGNPNPTFLLRDLKVIKSTNLNSKHISVILKSKMGYSIKSISFNSVNNEIGKLLLNYKNSFNVLGQISENIWNNKKTLQLTIRDIII